MANKTMHHVVIGSDTFEIVDQYAREHGVTIDSTLAQSGQAADAKAVGDALADKADADDVTALGESIDEVDANLQTFKEGTFVEIPSKNLCNPDDLWGGYLYYNTGLAVESTSYKVSAYMPVTQGKYLTFSRINTGIYGAYSMPAYAFYTDANEESFINGSGSTYKKNVLVPETAAYARVTFPNDIVNLLVELTDDGVPTGYEAYHAPAYELKDDIPIPIEQISGDIADKIEDVSVKGSNLIPVSETGIGAYIRSGSNVTFQPSYTTFRYAIVPVKKNTRYFVNYFPRWWILTDDDDVVIDGAQYFAPQKKAYIDTGNATRFYYTAEQYKWNSGVIISEGVTGRTGNIQQTELLEPLNQLSHDNFYACSLPKNYIYFTVGLSEKFYFRNMLALPDVNMVELGVGGFATREIDGVTITPASAGAFNNYLFTTYDSNLSVIEQNVNGQFGRRYADNVASCSALIIGDSIVEKNSGKIGQTMLDAFTSRGKTLTLLGSRGSGDSKHEGRSGWSAHDYVGGTTRGQDISQNPFYNSNTGKFDFSAYMTAQGYSGVDFVIINLGTNDLYECNINVAKDKINTLVDDISTIIDSIKAYNADQKVILNLPTPCTAKTTGTYALTPYKQKAIMAKFVYYASIMEVLITGWSYARCSHCHLILDGATEIEDLIHPTNAGLEKMGMELLSQINCFQNET